MMSPTGIAPALQLHPSRLCNLACAHCYSSSGPNVREELAIELLSRCLDDAASLGYRQLAVSGGEPLMYSHLAELLARARDLGMITTLTSNGTLLTAKRWNAIAPLVDVLAISIDGRPAEHDTIRCRAGAFARTVANLEVVRASKVPFGFIFTLTQHNADALDFVVRLAASEGARSVQVHPLTLHGRAAEMLTQSRPDGLELIAAIVEATRLGEALGVAVHVDALTQQQLRRHRDRLVPAKPVDVLTDVAPTLVVGSDAIVLPLTHEINPALQLGSLATATLKSLGADWLANGGGDTIADACERTWNELAEAEGAPAAYWYDEVAARTFH